MLIDKFLFKKDKKKGKTKESAKISNKKTDRDLLIFDLFTWFFSCLYMVILASIQYFFYCKNYNLLESTISCYMLAYIYSFLGYLCTIQGKHFPSFDEEYKTNKKWFIIQFVVAIIFTILVVSIYIIYMLTTYIMNML